METKKNTHGGARRFGRTKKLMTLYIDLSSVAYLETLTKHGERSKFINEAIKEKINRK